MWELGGVDDCRYSNFSWRTRMALRHKGLDVQLHPIALTDKATIAFSTGSTVPVIRDGDVIARDSWAIAEYLERAYPDRPSLFGGAAGQSLSRFFNVWVDRVVLVAAFPLVAVDALDVMRPEDRDYFAATIGKLAKSEPAALKQQQPTLLERFGRIVDPARAILKRQPYLAGDAPAYADYALFSIYQWARIACTADLVANDAAMAAWRDRLLDAHDGYARTAPPRRV